MSKNILFIDRDGTLITEPTDNFQIDSMEKLKFEPQVITALITLKNYGYKLVMITNQDGLGTESFPLDDFEGPHNFMLSVFKSQGIIFDDILICPHRLEDDCQCRKPNLGMVKPWLNNNCLNKKNSYVIGDRITDIELANKMNISGLHYNRKNCNWSDIKNRLTQHNRYAKVYRVTKETEINIEVWLDDNKASIINTNLIFFNHMLEQIIIHSGICIKLIAKGDIHIDDHHIIEDIGICLGQALLKAIGNKIGLNRYGFCLPMDDSIAKCVLDISGRPYLKFTADFKYQFIGDLSTEMIKHFFRTLSYSMHSTMHLSASGSNDHHKAESLFKVFGRTLREAIRIEGNVLLSSKGML